MFIKALIASAALIQTNLAATEIADSCISEHSHLYGV